MTVRFSLRFDLNSNYRFESFVEEPPRDWPVILDYLRRLWLIGENTILESEFFEPFQEPMRRLEVLDESHPVLCRGKVKIDDIRTSFQASSIKVLAHRMDC